jgi:GNAT superfamily N-acetyltransferase
MQNEDTSLNILGIADCPQFHAQIIDWERREWGDEWAEVVSAATARDQVPTIYVAVQDGQPVGCAMLIKYDMMTRLDLTPWLGGIYVPPEYRGQGIASRLVAFAMTRAAALKIPTWWLYTAHARSLYERFGWKFVEMAEYDGGPVSLMRFDFPVD